MSAKDQIFHARLSRLERHDRKRHHEPHAPHGDFKRDDFCLGIVLISIALAVVLVLVLVPWRVSVAKATLLQPPQFVKHITANKRRICTEGEYYDFTLQMCAPSIHVPIAFDATIMDTQTPACESFYRNSCGKWVAQHANENRAFSFAYHKNQAQIKAIITNTSTGSALNDFYQSCLFKNDHESTIELKHVMQVIAGNLRSHADLPTVLGRLARYGYTGPFVMSIERHPLEPRMIPLFTYDNLQVTELDVFNMINKARLVFGYNVLEVQQRIQAVLKVMRGLFEHSQETERVTGIVNFTDYVVNRFPRNVVRFEEVALHSPGLRPGEWLLRGSHSPINGWYNFFQALDGQGLRFQHDQDVWVVGKDYMKWLLVDGLNSFELSEWKAYIEFSIFYHGHQFEPHLEDNVYYKQHDRQGPIGLKGRVYGRLRRREAPTRSRQAPTVSAVEDCLRITQHMLPGLVARSFLDQIGLVNETRAQIRLDIYNLVMHVKQTLIETLAANTWLTLADKHLLIKKLERTIVRVAEPDEWAVEPFAGQIAADRYDHNMNLIRRYRVQRNMQLWHKDLPFSFNQSAFAFFAIPLSSVNAYYSPSSNTITVLAGILQLPFYSTAFNTLSKYAILGSVIGHELSHALDSHGLYWDHEGSFKPFGWLSEAGMRSFYSKTACIRNEFSAENHGCNSSALGPTGYGDATLSENIADLTGISLAYKALAPQSMSDKQYFFFVLSQAFCESYDLQHRCAAVQGDVHAVADFRIDLTFRNMPDFPTVFSCGNHQRMFKPANSICTIY